MEQGTQIPSDGGRTGVNGGTKGAGTRMEEGISQRSDKIGESHEKVFLTASRPVEVFVQSV